MNGVGDMSQSSMCDLVWILFEFIWYSIYLSKQMMFREHCDVAKVLKHNVPHYLAFYRI